MNRPFRHRLMLHIGAVLGVWLGVIFLGLFVVTRQVLREVHQDELALEARRIELAITAGGRFMPENKNWEELHHQHAEPRVHPFFVQVFDAEGRLAQTSANVRDVAVLPETPPHDEPTFGWTPGPQPLVVHVHPLRIEGQTVGTLRIASYDGGVTARTRLLAWGVPAVYLSVFLTLMALLAWAARRVVEPLEAITEHVQRPGWPTTPIVLPPHADAETRALALALEEAMQKREAAMEQVRDFSHHAAHELKTPLTALLGTVDVALRRDRDAHAYRDILYVVRQDVRHLVSLVQALLQISRLDQSATPPTTRQSVLSLVHESLHDADIAQDAVQIHAEGQLEGPLVWVREMLAIVLDNASKYGDKLNLVVESRADAISWSFTVRDAGPGFAPDVLLSADARFARASNVQHIAGSGLGLSIVRRIAERLGGTLTWGNAPEGGAWVCVSLPAQPKAGNVYHLKPTDTAIPPDAA